MGTKVVWMKARGISLRVIMRYVASLSEQFCFFCFLFLLNLMLKKKKKIFTDELTIQMAQTGK